MKKKVRSYGEHYIQRFLDYNNIYYIKEKTFKDCLSPKNNQLRFDFYLPQHNVLIEFQGPHHYKPVNKGYKAKRVHKTTVLHDEIKREFCRKTRIRLIEINQVDNIYETLLEELKG